MSAAALVEMEATVEALAREAVVVGVAMAATPTFIALTPTRGLAPAAQALCLALQQPHPAAPVAQQAARASPCC
jgi:hypothetical protein